MNEETSDYRHPAVVVKLKTSSQKGGTGAELTITSDIFGDDAHGQTAEVIADWLRNLALAEWGRLQAALAGPTLEEKLEASIKAVESEKNLASTKPVDRNEYINKLEENLLAK